MQIYVILQIKFEYHSTTKYISVKKKPENLVRMFSILQKRPILLEHNCIVW